MLTMGEVYDCEKVMNELEKPDKGICLMLIFQRRCSETNPFNYAQIMIDTIGDINAWYDSTYMGKQ